MHLSSYFLQKILNGSLMDVKYMKKLSVWGKTYLIFVGFNSL